MSYTKRQFVHQAFAEIGMASYVFDLSTEDLQRAVVRLDAMMDDWSGKSIVTGYPTSSSPENADLDVETEVPNYCNLAITLNLAVQLAPSFGKVVSPQTSAGAIKSYNTLLQRMTAMPPEMQFAETLPRGAGQKYWRISDNPFQPKPNNPVHSGPDSPLEFH